MSEFFDQYKRPEWKQFRDSIIRQRGESCERCGSKPGDGVFLQVHHIFYFAGKRPWEYEPEFVACLCDICHDLVHESAYQVKKRLAANWQHMDEILAMVKEIADHGMLHLWGESGPDQVSHRREVVANMMSGIGVM